MPARFMRPESVSMEPRVLKSIYGDMHIHRKMILHARPAIRFPAGPMVGEGSIQVIFGLVWFALILSVTPIIGAETDPAPLRDNPVSSPRDSKARMRLKEIPPAPAFPRAIGTLPETTQPHPLAQRHLREGRKRFNEDLWPEAIAELEKALEFDPRLTEAHLLLARAALQYGDDSRAESQLREVLKYHTRNVLAHRLLGEIAWRKKDSAEAIAELRLALLAGTDLPDRPEALLARWTLASALREEGYFSAAAHQLDVYLEAVDQPSQAMKDHPELRESMERNRSTAIIMLAELRTELGEHVEAAAAYSNAAALFPDDASLRRKLAFALARAGQGEAALDAARRWSLGLPEPVDGLETLKEICDLLGQPQQYENELIRLAESSHDSRMVVDLVMTLLDRDKPTEARALLERASSNGALDTRGRYLLARLIAQSGEAAEAYRLIIAALQEDPTTEGQAMSLLEGSDAEIDSSIFIKPAEEMAGEAPDNAFARFGLGFLLMCHHEDEQAAEELNAAIDLDNSFGAPHAAMARLSIRQKRWANAIAIAEDATVHGIKSTRLQLCKGLAHDALDEYAKAESAFLESFSLDRSSPLPLFRLAQSLDRRGEAQRCEELYRRILDDVDPRFMPAREQLVLWYLNRRHYDKCREYFSDFERLGQRGPIVDRCRALLALTTSKADTAKARLEEYTQALRTILKEYPGDAPTWLELARSYSTVSDFDRALEHVESSLRIDPDYLQARELKAVVLVKKLEFDLARKTVEGLLVDRPRDAAYLRKLLDIARNRADYQAAIDLLKRLIKRDDLNKRRNVYTNQLIDVLLRAGRLDEAVASSKKWLDESPKDRVRRRIYLSTLTRAGRHDGAVELAERFLKESPDERSEQIQLLIQLQGAKRYMEAQQRVLSWLSESGNDIELNIALIRLCWNSKQWDDAIDIARTGAELPKYRAQYEGLLGMSYRFARRFDEAIEFYREKANALEPRFAYRDLLDVLIEAERYGEAERVVNKILRPHLEARSEGRIHDADLIVRMRQYLADIYQNTNREAQAFQQLEAIHSMVPEDPAINNNLGYSWADAGMHLDRAEIMIRFALSQDPRSAANLDSLGWVLYKQGKWDESLRYLRRSRRMSERDDPIILNHLADTLYRLDKYDEARSLWKMAVDLCDPASDPPPNREHRLLRGVLQSKISAFDAGDPVSTATIVAPTPTTQPTTKPQPTTTQVPTITPVP